MHPNDAAYINQDRGSLPEDTREQDSESNKSSIERNEDDEDKLDDSSEDEDKNKSDSENEESDNDEDKSKRSSTSASRKSSSSSQEDEVNRKQDEKTDKNKPPSDDIAAEVADNLTYEEKVKKAFVGDLDFSYSEKVKIVRIFTSSTFTGTHLEPFFTLIKTMFIFQKFLNARKKSIQNTRHAHIYFTEDIVTFRNLSKRHARYLFSDSVARFFKEWDSFPRI